MFHFALNQKYTNLNKNRGINIFYDNRVSIPVWFLLLVFYNLHSVQKKLGDFGGKYFKYGRRCGHQAVGSFYQLLSYYMSWYQGG